MNATAIYRSIAFFLLAAGCEIGGGYLVWKVIKDDQPLWLGILGAIVLVLYGVVATFQPASFGRTDAAYGGIYGEQSRHSL